MAYLFMYQVFTWNTCTLVIVCVSDNDACVVVDVSTPARQNTGVMASTTSTTDKHTPLKIQY